MKDSRLFHALDGIPPEGLAVLWARVDEGGRERIERFARELVGVKPAVNGRDLIELGYEPSERFTAILARALDDRLDGRVLGRDAELANLKRIAARHLNGKGRKDRV